MAIVYKKSELLTDTKLHYCPGCTHGIAHKLTAEVLEEFGAKNNVIGVAPVGCAVFAYNYFDCDMQEAAHGRAPAVASAIKRVYPDKFVFSYQGDGDLASIGMAETIHAAARGENITIIFINNAIYGMTGGQMAPTTLVGQKTTTCQNGRDPKVNGNPIGMCEVLSQLKGPAFIARAALCDVQHVREAKKYIRQAFQCQKDKKGFALVELLSSCPTNWGMTPIQATQFVREQMTQTFPLGVFKDITKEEK